MANCVQCGRELPSFSFGDASDRCVNCRRQQAMAAGRQPVDVPPGPAPVRKPTLAESARAFPVTAAIVGINLAIYAACAIASVVTREGSPWDFSSRMLLRFGADYGPLTLDNEWWRLFTSMWLHGGLIHVAANMYGLWGFGRITERIYGRSRYAIIYIVTGLASSLASVAWHSDPKVSVGASGAIFGVVGALVWPFYRKRLKLPPPVMSSMLRNIGTVIVINLVIGASIPVIDNAAHVGGLVAGLILGAIFIQLIVWGAEPASSAWKVAAASAIVLCAAFAGIRRERLAEMLPAASIYALQTGHGQLALARAQRAVQLRPRDADAHYALGELKMHSTQFADAANEFLTAHQLNPQDTDISTRLGSAYVALKDWPAAESILREVLNEDKTNVEALAGLGMTLAATNRYEEAISTLTQATTVNPRSAQAQYALGAVLAEHGHAEEALGPLQRAVQLAPSNAAFQAALKSAQAAAAKGR